MAGVSLSLLLALTGCETPGLHDGVHALQFADIPVPSGLQLQDEYHASDSLQIGDYRYGNFVYSGAAPLAQVGAYMRDRMPQHAWHLVEESETADGGQLMRFRRGRYWADCQLSRRDARTTMQVSVRTDIGEK